MRDPRHLSLCVITDRRLSRARTVATIVRQALTGGAPIIQLREKELPAREVFELALELRRITREAGALFIVNDRVDIAAASGADGVHLGQDDLPVAAARRLLGAGALVGISARTVEQARRAERDGADYLGVGPVYDARSTKPDALEAQGVELIRTVGTGSDLPIVAIGGISAGRAAAPVRAGAAGVAVISAVVAADDVAGAARELRREVLEALEGKAKR